MNWEVYRPSAIAGKLAAGYRDEAQQIVRRIKCLSYIVD